MLRSSLGSSPSRVGVAGGESAGVNTEPVTSASLTSGVDKLDLTKGFSDMVLQPASQSSPAAASTTRLAFTLIRRPQKLQARAGWLRFRCPGMALIGARKVLKRLII